MPLSHRARRAPAAALLAAVLTTVLALGLAGRAAAAPGAQATTTASTARNLLTFALAAYAGPWGGFSGGLWNSPNTVCWSCNQGGPGSAAATLYMLTGRTTPTLLTEAEQTFDTAIATRRQPSGAFLGPPGDTQSPDVATMFFGNELGNAYLVLQPVLDPFRRARWQAALASAATFLIHNGNLSWYTNGNINLGNAELFYLAWRATGNPTFQLAYAGAFNFALHPPQARWPGRGLVLVRTPTRADWSDGAGYVTESGPGGTGFDAEYTSMQLDIAARMYLLSGDQRWLQLANVMVNMLLPRITAAFWLDTSGGTRHPQAGRQVPLLSSAFAVLGLDGGRSDLLGDIAPALTETGSTIISTGNAYGEVYRRALGDDVSVIALASALARPVGWASGTAVTGSPPAAVPRHNGARRTVRAAHAVRVHRVARRHRKRARRARHG